MPAVTPQSVSARLRRLGFRPVPRSRDGVHVSNAVNGACVSVSFPSDAHAQRVARDAWEALAEAGYRLRRADDTETFTLFTVVGHGDLAPAPTPAERDEPETADDWARLLAAGDGAGLIPTDAARELFARGAITREPTSARHGIGVSFVRLSGLEHRGDLAAAARTTFRKARIAYERGVLGNATDPQKRALWDAATDVLRYCTSDELLTDARDALARLEARA